MFSAVVSSRDGKLLRFMTTPSVEPKNERET